MSASKESHERLSGFALGSHALGCGPSVSVVFALSVDDDSRYLLAHAEVTRVRDGHRTAGRNG